MNVQNAAPSAIAMVIEKDVDVPMRDGALLKADVFRPTHDAQVPAILNLGPYQKDRLWVPPPELEEPATPHMTWEAVTPEWWVPKNYAAVRVDGRGSGRSPGQADPWSLGEAIDFYDAIEWAGAQPWCNGNVGLLGISYFAINQWFVANLKPPSLAAMIPWEGFADIYRDALFHGGITSTFMTNWYTAHFLHHQIGRGSREHPDRWQKNILLDWIGNNLDTGALRGGQADWDAIDVPFMSVGNWTGMGLHLRGNTEAFMRSKTKHKKLRIHNRSHVHPFYTDEAKADQIRFFDYWLKGIDNGVMKDPPIKLAIRHGNDKIEWRHEHEWPIARTQWTKLYLDVSAQPGQAANAGVLNEKKPEKTASRSYDSYAHGLMGSTAASSQAVMGGVVKPGMGVSFDTAPMPTDMEVTGPLAATLYVSSETEDMDLFLTIRNIDPEGKDVPESGQAGTPVTVAKGWLRVSHRELDPELSLPYRPYHKHTRRQYLTPGEIVKVEVEIWPTSMVFKKGHRLRLDVQPRDGLGSQGYLHYHADYNIGRNTLHSGGEHESFLLLPVIPKATSSKA